MTVESVWLAVLLEAPTLAVVAMLVLLYIRVGRLEKRLPPNGNGNGNVRTIPRPGPGPD